MSVIGGAEHSLCGWAYDKGGEEGEEDLKPTKKRIVTCDLCIDQILNCRNVRIK